MSHFAWNWYLAGQWNFDGDGNDFSQQATVKGHPEHPRVAVGVHQRHLRSRIKHRSVTILHLAKGGANAHQHCLVWMRVRGHRGRRGRRHWQPASENRPKGSCLKTCIWPPLVWLWCIKNSSYVNTFFETNSIQIRSIKACYFLIGFNTVEV